MGLDVTTTTTTRPSNELEEVVPDTTTTGPGLRSTPRPDYSDKKNFREIFFGRKDTENDVRPHSLTLTHIYICFLDSGTNSVDAIEATTT
jgi:hypothetical protein